MRLEPEGKMEGGSEGGEVMARPEPTCCLCMWLWRSSEQGGTASSEPASLPNRPKSPPRKLIPPSIHPNEPGPAKHTLLNTQPSISLFTINTAHQLNTHHVHKHTHTAYIMNKQWGEKATIASYICTSVLMRLHACRNAAIWDDMAIA